MTALFAPSVEAAPIVARPYQIDAREAIAREFDRVQSAFIAMPTGTGKTSVFSLEARDVVAADGQALIIVDRTELVEQAAATIGRVLGFDPSVDQADRWADMNSPVIVATVQTLTSSGRGFGDHRFTRYDPARFTRVIVDECHLAITRRHRLVLDHFRQNPDCKILGVTATPSRADNRSMRQQFTTCAYRYEIRDAIDDGWLVPIEGEHVDVMSLDLSVLPDRRGDWTDEQISALMESSPTVYETCGSLLELCAGEPTLVFGARVAHVAAMAAQLNQERPGSARWVSGETDPDERRYVIDMFREGALEFLLNVDVLTVGFDAPVVRNVAIARPTKSWARFVQQVGRGTRPLTGVVDGLDDAYERRAAIAASGKPRLRVINFGDRAGGVDLVGPEDVLAGSMRDPEVVKRAKELRKEGGAVEERLARAEREVDEERQRAAEIEAAPVRVSVEVARRKVDLFQRGYGDVGMPVRANPASPAQIAFLQKMGVEPSVIRRRQHDQRAMGELVGIVKGRLDKGLCTWKQGRLLAGAGYAKHEYAGLSKDQASALIDRVKANGWRKVT